MSTDLELKTEPVMKAFAELDAATSKFLRHLGSANAAPLCRGHVQSISPAGDKFTGQCLDTPYVVRWGAVAVEGRPALEEFEFAARHEGEPVVLTRVYLGLTGKLSLDSGQLVPLCEYDDPEVARMLAGLVLTGLLSSVIYAPRDRVYDLHELEDPAPDETLAD
ncbi:hypothetical protein QTI17_34715 [Variovorax sp. J31P179]|uniref:hypothetical protein n=1 Tax=Variovorax sp. J31P179 TaxID=3053508 RepID=UPI0025783705|nr:hypothetical protein [Variovorax sp. J31P179]MDM0085743.1 hypothetical protein [Variovorax sp. J31P179]